MLKWPKAAEVDRAARSWATATAERHPDILSIGYFGSYARGDWGVGSDLDLIVVLASGSLDRSGLPYRDWRLETLPVPAELLSYSADEWRQLMLSDRRFATTLREEAVWLVGEGRQPQP